jgi:Cof subfamily protein (haloacid dehalogenase superfamily)
VIRLLAVDIDGTLLDSRGQLPEAHLDALADASAAGIALTLVTGRSFHFARPVAELLGLPLTLIVNNGAVTRRLDGAILGRQVLPRDVAREILAATPAFEDSVALIFDRPAGAAAGSGGEGTDERQIVYERMDWTHPNRRGYFAKNRAYIGEAAPLASALTEDPLQLMFNGEVAPMRALVAALAGLAIADRFAVAVTEYERRDFSLVDVTAAGCSKGAALARWTAAQGIAPAEVMAVGDNLNDLEMLQFAGTGIAMGNAVGALKTHGFPVTASNDENGLALAIRRFALSPRPDR